MEAEVLISISNYLLSVFNRYQSKGYINSVPAVRCKFHLFTYSNHGGKYAFKFFDNSGNEIAFYKVFETVVKDYRQAMNGGVKGRDYNPDWLKFPVSSKHIDIYKPFKKAA